MSESLFDEAQWVAEQVARYGPLIGGAELRQVLGFRTQDAFQKARAGGTLGVRVFTLAGRKGWFATTREACEWVMRQRSPKQK